MSPTDPSPLRHLVTGSGSGIGAALARRLHERGDEVVHLARSAARADELVAGLPGSTAVVADLAAPAAELAALTLPDRLDTLLHVAGTVEVGTLAERDIDVVDEQVRVNLVAPAALTRAALPALRATRGLVLFVNSTSGLTANPGWAGYAASKFGLRGLADALRAEEASYGVRVTSVYPSRTASPMQQKVHEQEGRDYDPSAFMSADTVAAAIVDAIDLPRDATVTDVTLRSHG